MKKKTSLYSVVRPWGNHWELVFLEKKTEEECLKYIAQRQVEALENPTEGNQELADNLYLKREE